MAKIVVGGIPKEPDVKLLMEAYPNLKAGDAVSHEEVEGVIHLARTSARYRVVTLGWRDRVEKEKGLKLDAVPGVGFRVLTEEDRTRRAVDRGRKGVRQIGRSVRDIGMVQTEKLTDEGRANHLHARRQLEAAAMAGREAMKQIPQPIAATKALPRLVPAQQPKKSASGE